MPNAHACGLRLNDFSLPKTFAAPKPAIATDVPEDNLKNSQGQEEAACFFADF